MFARTPFAPTLSPAALTLTGLRVAGLGGRAIGYPGATPGGTNSKPEGSKTPAPTRPQGRQQEEAVMRDFTTPAAAVTPVVLVSVGEGRAAWHRGLDAYGADPRSAASPRPLDSI